MMDETYWRRWRDQVLLPTDGAYLNSGSFSPLPRCVWEELTDLRLRLATQPSHFLWRVAAGKLDEARTRLANYLHAHADRLLLLPNVTYAVNLAVRSLELGPGSEVLMGNQEYGAMRYCWDEAAQRTGCSVRIADIPLSPKDPGEIVEAFRRELRPQTRVLFFSHVSSPTGLVFPAKELCRLADHHGALSVVDGAHAPGMLPLDLQDVDADFYGANCHKWMMAPTGAGFLYVRAERKRLLKPLITSWGWDRPSEDRLDEDSKWGGSYWARNFEFHGTQDRCPQMVLPTVLDFRDQMGESAIHDRSRELVAAARRLAEENVFQPVTPEHPDLHGSLLAIEVPRVNALAARDWMWNERRIEAPVTETQGRQFLRISAAWFNTTEEIHQAIEALCALPAAQLL